MGRLRGVLSWAFVRGPAAAYELADSGSSLFGIGAIVVMLLVGALGAGVGALVGLVAHSSVGDSAFVGGMIGLGVVVAWLVLMVVVVAVLWVRGVSPVETATGEGPTGRHAAHASGWRRRGAPLVPGSLVAFFLLIAIPFGALGLHARSVARPADEPTAITHGTVVVIHEPGLLDKSSGTVDIRYSVGGVDHTFETDRDPGEHFFRLGDVVPVEYVIAEPAKGRAVWAVESARDDRGFWLWLAGICAVLGLLSGAGYLVGRLRSSGRRGG
ncbi:hypothetical protein EV649_3113 [Kribbella sp. VKM Ac-2569]|uniref:hypothetical protein n=1 Tax=Kribbella sp. VKM Ac-2569 TaxID=2512220 RepID=UPI00102CE89E|nr:hypothetical protein [Kribbella sp. VKM Ac-2569]RZT19973.1 hypothetical protein EV649_3113 [Kribbella sp. VKM Ac-2569]